MFHLCRSVPQSEFNVGFDDGLVLSFASGRNRLYIKHHGPEGETGDLYPPLPPALGPTATVRRPRGPQRGHLPRLRAVLD